MGWLNRKKTIFASLGVFAACFAGQAEATENGASLYLLGSGGPGTAVMAPFEGVYLDKLIWIYDGNASAEREFPVNGNIAVGLDMTVVAEFPTILVVPSTNVLGGTLALGVTVPVGAPIVDVDALLTGPGGNTRAASVHDSALTTGDPVAVVMMGWKSGDLNFQLSSIINTPIGHYREGQLANLSLHRWAVDGSAAVSWHDAEAGWDVSAKAGYTWNGRNDFTDYDSGDEIHVEGAIEHSFSPAFSLGAQVGWAKQVSDDKGPLGPFRGEVLAVGATASTTVMMAGKPGTFRGRYMHEVDVTNRPKGSTFWIDFSYPLAMKIPG